MERQFSLESGVSFLKGNRCMLKCQWDPGVWPGGTFDCHFLFPCLWLFCLAFPTFSFMSRLASPMRMVNSGPFQSYGECVWQEGQAQCANSRMTEKPLSLSPFHQTLLLSGLVESLVMVIWAGLGVGRASPQGCLAVLCWGGGHK